MIRPILKWAGGKRQILDSLVSHLPEFYVKYHEPFFGGGALYFYLQPEDAIISDLNEELMNVYRCIRDDFESLIDELSSGYYIYDENRYYEIRALDHEEDWHLKSNSIKRACRTIYLNRTGFNGLYRVNRNNLFNVPFGRYKDPKIFDGTILRKVSVALKKTTILSIDFRKSMHEIKEHDFCYADPPYIPISSSSNFTSYTRNGFVIKDQEDLARIARDLDDRGAYVMISNHDHEYIRELYKEFNIHEIDARRSINCKGNKRGNVRELIITNY